MNPRPPLLDTMPSAFARGSSTKYWLKNAAPTKSGRLGIASETEAVPAGWRGRQTRVIKVQNTQGTMVIDMRDPATRSLVWRAVATEDEPNPSKLAEKLDDMVKKAIKEYPSKK